MMAMQQIESRYDLVVLDCGAGISRNVLSFAATADTILVVTTPEPTSLTDAYATIKVIPQLTAGRPQAAQTAGGIGLVVNSVNSRREGSEVYERVSSVAARFLQLPVADYGYILRDELVPAAIRERSPLFLRYPRSHAAGCLRAIAAQLSREIGQPQAEQGLFYRFVNLFR
jgi:flagellar biosynthesis protein FlhG